MRVVDVDDVLPSVVGDDIEDGLVMLRTEAEGVVHETGSRYGHLNTNTEFSDQNSAAFI